MHRELDGSRILSESDFHEEIARVLGFPAYYGKNLDALDDCLSDFANDVKLVWRQSRVSENAIGPRFDRIRAVLNDAARETNFEISFA